MDDMAIEAKEDTEVKNISDGSCHQAYNLILGSITASQFHQSHMLTDKVLDNIGPTESHLGSQDRHWANNGHTAIKTHKNKYH